MSDSVVSELVTKFSFIGDMTPLHKFKEGLGQDIKKLSLFTAGVAGAIGALATFTKVTLESVNTLNDLSHNIGVPIETMQKLGYVAEQNGSSIDAMNSTLSTLSQKIGDASIHGSAQFAELGISVRKVNGDVKNAAEVFEEIRRRFNKSDFSTQQKESLATSLGIDRSLISTLTLSDAKMKDLTKEATKHGIVTAKGAEKAKEFDEALKRLAWSSTSLARDFAIFMAPALTDIIDILDGVFSAVGIFWGALTDVWNATPKGVKLLGELAGGIYLVSNATKIWAGVSALLDVALSPITLIVASIAGAILVVQDLVVAAEGGKSVIADFFKSFLHINITPFLKGIRKEIEALSNDILKVVNIVGNFWKGDWGNNGISLHKVSGFGDTIERTLSSILHLQLPTQTTSTQNNTNNNHTVTNNTFNIVAARDPQKTAMTVSHKLEKTNVGGGHHG